MSTLLENMVLIPYAFPPNLSQVKMMRPQTPQKTQRWVP